MPPRTTYEKILAGQIGQIEVSCTEAGADVTLDGERVFTAPGSIFSSSSATASTVVRISCGFITRVRPGGSMTLPLSLLAGKATSAWSAYFKASLASPAGLRYGPQADVPG